MLAVRSKKIIISAILYLLLLLDSGFHFVAEGGELLYIQLIMSIILMLICKAYISRQILMVLFVLTFLAICGTIFSGDSIRNLTVSVIELTTGFFIACSFAFGAPLRNMKILRTVMMAICICSLIAFFMTSLRVGFTERLPIFTSSNNIKCYFWGLSFSYVPGEYYIARNLGLFWEPGAFQTYIILALVDELFGEESKLAVFVYTVTILTTLSSTGIVCLLLIWVFYGFSKGINRRGVLIITALGCVITLMYSNLNIIPDNIRFNLIDKVLSFFNGNTQEYTSVTTRINSIIYGVKLILESPFCGIGRGLEKLQLSAGNSIISCTPVNWLLQYGVFFGGIALIGLYRTLRGISKIPIINFFIFIVILISISTEAFNMSPTIFFLVFLGYTMENRSNTLSR